MKFEYNIKVFAAMALLATAVSCSEEEWQPGPDVSPDCMGVYFEQLSSYDLLVGPDDSRQIPITVGRVLTDEAATVNFVVSSCPDGAVVPSSLAFEAGEQSKTLYIDIDGMPSKTSGTVAIAIPEEMTSPYTAGSPDLNLKINVSGKWELFAKDAVVSFSQTYPNMTTDIFMLDGTQNFKLPDFLGSGLDFTFTFKNPAAGDFSYVPLSNYQDVHDYWGATYEYNGWFLYDPETGEHPYWAPDGVTYIADLEFDSDYSYGYVSDNYLYFNGWTSFADGSGAFLDIFVTYEPLFNPFGTMEQ